MLNFVGNSQAATFLFATGLGFALGIFYDVFRVLRHGFKPKMIVGALWDMVFWLTLTVFLFFILLQTNFGQLRFFIFLGLLIGFVLHLSTLSKLIISLTKRAKKGLRLGKKYAMMKGNEALSEVKRHGQKVLKFTKTKKTTAD